MIDPDRYFPLPTHQAELVNFLETRRSNLAKFMEAPAPNPDELHKLLTIAARAPDHRKLTPWRFIIFQNEARTHLGDVIAHRMQSQNPDISPKRLQQERQKPERAPLIVAIISSPKDCPRGTPQWEQELSSAIVCYNLCLAAQAHGFGAQWLTEWISYDEIILSEIGVKPSERVAGFIYIGSTEVPTKERPRPSIEDHVTFWNASN